MRRSLKSPDNMCYSGLYLKSPVLSDGHYYDINAGKFACHHSDLDRKMNAGQKI